MKRRVRRRFYVEAALATLTGVLAVITLISREWIEAVFHVDPDNHHGWLEWLIVGVLAFTSLAFAAVARTERRGSEPLSARRA